MEREQRLRTIVSSRLTSVIAVCVNFEDPRNAAAILRTCEALGILEVFVIEEDFPFQPAPKVTHGAEKWVRLRRFRRAELAFQELRERGFRIFAAAPQGAIVLEEIPVDYPLALVFGNEKEGLSPEVLARCDGTFRIPMFGFSQSLNVSVAAGIALYFVSSARRRFLGKNGDLSPADEAALLAKYREDHPLSSGGGLSRGGRPPGWDYN
ncbi:MAG: TrmH family RNA methyltransferase [Candidatus Bipolaricaulaceae bacterium]